MQSFAARIEIDYSRQVYTFVRVPDDEREAFGKPGNSHVFHYLRIPDDVAQALGAVKRMRIRGKLNNVDINRCLTLLPGDVFVIMLSNNILSSLKARDGAEIRVSIEPDPDPNFVEIPEELEAALDQMPDVQAKFMAMTPGKRRSLVYYVETAKHVDTRIKRALELCRKIQTNTLYSQRGKSK